MSTELSSPREDDLQTQTRMFWNGSEEEKTVEVFI